MVNRASSLSSRGSRERAISPTVEEIAAAFGWQAHTVRGALYGALRKKLGLDVTSERGEGKGRVYRIGS